MDAAFIRRVKRLMAHDPGAVVRHLQKMAESFGRNRLLALARHAQGKDREAREIVWRTLLSGRNLTQVEREWLTEFLREMASDPLPGAERVVRSFCLDGGMDRAVSRLGRLEEWLDKPGTLVPERYFVQFCKGYSSYTPLVTSAVPYLKSHGGGYFLGLGGLGCVVDPGHHFLYQFFRSQLSLRDVGTVVVTHFHDDHFADLPGLLSLLHQCRIRHKPTRGTRLFLDANTHSAFKRLLKGEQDPQPTVLRATRRNPVVLNDGTVLRVLPTYHDVYDCRDSGFGLVIEMPAMGSQVLITGDTAWGSRVKSAYQALSDLPCVLIAHVSTAWPEEAITLLAGTRPRFHKNHLCVHGLCKAIETLGSRLRRVVLSEIGEELRDCIRPLANLITREYHIECHVGMNNSRCEFRSDGRSTWVEATVADHSPSGG